MTSKFEQKLAERRAAEEAAKAVPPPPPPSTPSDFADLTPEDPYQRSPEDQSLDEAVNRIGIIDAYRKWINKSAVNPADKRTEGIKVSCPLPSHPDRDPSAWLNTDKNTWFCGGCQEGGDHYDLAAIHFGYQRPGYKSGADFHNLRRDMARSFGWTFVSLPGVMAPIPVPPEESRESTPADESVDSPVAPVVSITGDDDDEEEEIVFPTLDWTNIVEPNTFLDEYMRVTCMDDIPEEYNFWNGIIAVGMAIGKDVTLYDRVPVYGNLFVCLTGHTGDGKSRSFNHLKTLMRRALPHRWDDATSKGTHWINTPASAEALIHGFSKPIPDPSNPKSVAYYAPVRGIVEFNELSALVGRTSRQGNVMKPTLMEMYDVQQVVSTISMTHGNNQAHDPYCTVWTTTQPRALKKLINQADADSGFLNRWVFASGKQKQRYAVGGIQIDTHTCDPLLDNLRGWIMMGKQIQWSAEALERFSTFFHELLHPKQQADESGLLTRMDLLMKKLILLLSANGHHDVVPVEIVDKVIKMYPYLIAAYAIPAAQLGSTLMNECQEEIARHVRQLTEKGRPPSQRDLVIRLKRKKYPLDLVSKVLKYMTELGEIEPVISKGVGRPTVRYKYVI